MLVYKYDLVFFSHNQIKSKTVPNRKVARRSINELSESLKQAKGIKPGIVFLNSSLRNVFKAVPQENPSVAKTAKMGGDKFNRSITPNDKKMWNIRSNEIKNIDRPKPAVKQIDSIKNGVNKFAKIFESLQEAQVSMDNINFPKPMLKEVNTNKYCDGLVQQLITKVPDQKVPYDVEKNMKNRRKEIIRKLVKK